MEEHKTKGGNPDIDVSFQYLKMFLEENDEKLGEIYNNYKTGKLTTKEIKDYTVNKLNYFLKKHQKEMKKAEKVVEKFMD